MILYWISFLQTVSPQTKRIYPDSPEELSRILFSDDKQMEKYAIRELQRQSKLVHKKQTSRPDSIAFLEAKRDLIQFESTVIPACVSNIYKPHIVKGCVRISEKLQDDLVLSTAKSIINTYPPNVKRFLHRKSQERE
jgi:hypothetical protein